MQRPYLLTLLFCACGEPAAMPHDLDAGMTTLDAGSSANHTAHSSSTHTSGRNTPIRFSLLDAEIRDGWGDAGSPFAGDAAEDEALNAWTIDWDEFKREGCKPDLRDPGDPSIAIDAWGSSPIGLSLPPLEEVSFSADVIDLLIASGRAVRFISLSGDPARDAPELLNTLKPLAGEILHGVYFGGEEVNTEESTELKRLLAVDHGQLYSVDPRQTRDLACGVLNALLAAHHSELRCARVSQDETFIVAEPDSVRALFRDRLLRAPPVPF
jgi:hypothetical protein